MNKKAEDSQLLEYLGYLILIAVIIVSFINVNTKIKDSTVFQQKAQAIEISLIHDIVQYSPSKTEYSYKIENKTISIDSCKIILQEQGKPFYLYYCSNNEISNTFRQEINKDIIAFKNEKSPN